MGSKSWLGPLLENVPKDAAHQLTVVAAQGLTYRNVTQQETVQAEHPTGDPHFWLNPLNVITYVNNIRDGLIKVDPAGRAIYTQNAANYIVKLHDLDAWIQSQVAKIPPADRLIVTNHESFGYFADRYGFTIVGTLLPSFSDVASPSAQELARLIDAIRASHVRVIFLETGTNRALAQQVALDTHVKVVADLYTHSLSGSEGPAPTYIQMMKYDTTQIVQALAP